MRPEAWVLGGLYFLWMWPASDDPRRLRLAAMVVAAPLIWALLGPARHRRRRCTRCTGRPTSPRPSTAAATSVDAPYWTAQYYGYTLREPLVIGIPIGLYFAWRYRRRAAILPLVVVAAMTAVFMVGPVFGLPLIGRYVRTPSVLLTLFYGLAVCGFLLRPGPRVPGACGAASGSSPRCSRSRSSPGTTGCSPTSSDRLDRDGRMYEELRAAARAPAVREAVERCGGRISASDHRPLPHLRYWLGTDPGQRRDDRARARARWPTC